MFSTPLICSSSGVATVSAIVFGLAPGNWAFTTTDGGTTSGYSEIGSCVIAIRPARKMTTEIAPATMGRSIKKRDRFTALSFSCSYYVARARRGLSAGEFPVAAGVEGHLVARHHALQTIEDHALTGLETRRHHALAIDRLTQRDLTKDCLIAGTDNIDEP